jgi:adenylate cyclase
MSETVRITINGREIEIEKGKSILVASMKGEVRHMHLCGGRGLCTTCRVVVLEGMENLSTMENYERFSLRGHLSFSPDVRLACQAKVLGHARVETLLPTIGRLDYRGK